MKIKNNEIARPFTEHEVKEFETSAHRDNAVVNKSTITIGDSVRLQNNTVYKVVDIYHVFDMDLNPVDVICVDYGTLGSRAVKHEDIIEVLKNEN